MARMRATSSRSSVNCAVPGAISHLLPFLLAAALISSSLHELAAQTNKLTTTLDGITFDSAYDNGSLAGVSRRSLDDYDAAIFIESGEKGTSQYWFRFTMSGVAGRTLTLHLNHSQNPVPFLRSLDPGPGAWRRMTATEAPNTSTITLAFGADTQKVELAFFEPLGYSEIVSAVSALTAASPYAATVTLGKSFQNRDLHLVTVNNPQYADAGKKRVWVHARVHGGEVTATHAMLGILSQVLEDSETGRRLRQYVTFHIVPQVNVDGIYLGHTRWDAQGIDEESEWCNIRVPEVAAIKVQVDALMATSNPISVALNLHSTVGAFSDSFFWKHVSPSVPASFEALEQSYEDAVNAATPLFNNLAPQTSQLSACSFIESYFWNNWGQSVMAMTEEGHFYHRITDGAWIVGADYREIGRAMARALIAYYNLPPSSEPDLVPILLSQPVSQILPLGQPLGLSVTCTSAPPASYQWWFNGEPIAGATNRAYSNLVTQVTQAGAYALVATNTAGSVTSAVARLIVMNGSGTPIAFADDFDVSTANRWIEWPGSANGVSDYTSSYSFDYSTYFSTFLGTNIPSAPNSSGGTRRGLKLTVNKNDALAANAAVCLYPKWQSFTGAHALKFDLWMNYPGGAGGSGSSGSTENAYFGLDTSGNCTNWDAASAAPSDGVWFTVTGEGGAAADYRAYVGGTNRAPIGLAFAVSGLAASGATNADGVTYPFLNYFPSPTYQSPGSPGKRWVQVEVSQTASNILTWHMNGNLLAQRTNSTAFTNGNVMLGYMDLYSSIASPAADAFLVYDNVRVELDGTALKPVIALPPANQASLVGQPALFSVTASGLGPLSYQWHHGGTNLPGATISRLTLPVVQTADAGSYDVLVGNAAGNVSSLPATLTVLPPANTNATPITATLDHNTLQIGWPADHLGWRLETQTNGLDMSLSTNWVTVAGSVSTNLMVITISPQTPAAFFRLVYP